MRLLQRLELTLYSKHPASGKLPQRVKSVAARNLLAPLAVSESTRVKDSPAVEQPPTLGFLGSSGGAMVVHKVEVEPEGKKRKSLLQQLRGAGRTKTSSSSTTTVTTPAPRAGGPKGRDFRGEDRCPVWVQGDKRGFQHSPSKFQSSFRGLRPHPTDQPNPLPSLHSDKWVKPDSIHSMQGCPLSIPTQSISSLLFVLRYTKPLYVDTHIPLPPSRTHPSTYLPPSLDPQSLCARRIQFQLGAVWGRPPSPHTAGKLISPGVNG
jgi:hypothetical protein